MSFYTANGILKTLAENGGAPMPLSFIAICVKQYHLYLEHLEYLLPKLEFLDIDAFNNLSDLLHYPLPSDRLPLFFFLQKDGHSTKIRPTDVWANISK